MSLLQRESRPQSVQNESMGHDATDVPQSFGCVAVHGCVSFFLFSFSLNNLIALLAYLDVFIFDRWNPIVFLIIHVIFEVFGFK